MTETSQTCASYERDPWVLCLGPSDEDTVTGTVYEPGTPAPISKTDMCMHTHTHPIVPETL